MEICCDFTPEQILLKYCFWPRFADIYAYSKLKFIHNQKKKNYKKQNQNKTNQKTIKKNCTKLHENFLPLTNTQSLDTDSGDTI